MKGTINEGLELRKLPVKYAFTLAQILEISQGWKELMAVIPDLDRPPLLKYTVEHMRLVEEASIKLKRTCSEILLDEWGTSGKIRPTLGVLVNLLAEAQLYRAAEYVSLDVMKGTELKRPADGPAARVTIPDTEELSRGTVKLSMSDSSVSAIAAEISASGTIQAHSRLPISIAYNEPSTQKQEPLCPSSTAYLGQSEVTRRICNELSESDAGGTGVCVFSYNDLVKNTNEFDNEHLLGRGGFGSVFKAYFPQHGYVAVKKLLSSGAAVEGLTGDQFSNELLLVAGLSHPNILSLTGYSCDGPDLCLVYPFMVNGSLQDRLECKDGTRVVNWQTRISIAKGAASGLCYLHSQRPKPLVHRDMKSANVLLGQNFEAKIADFGLVRHASRGTLTDTVMLTTTVLGTSAYMAPEAFRGDISTKIDVFSFGVVDMIGNTLGSRHVYKTAAVNQVIIQSPEKISVATIPQATFPVLLELVTGLPPFDEERSGCDLASHVDEIDNFDELRDQKLAPESIEPMRQLYNHALTCLAEKKSRPTMDAVLEHLNGLVV